MKKIVLLTGVAVALLAGSSAYARVDVDLNVGVPVYAAPVVVAPAYVSPYPTYYDPHHRAHDWRYWHDVHEHDRPNYYHR
jgi:hypothetical protein